MGYPPSWLTIIGDCSGLLEAFFCQMPFLSSFPFPHPFHSWVRNLSLYGQLAKKSKVPLFMITNVNIAKPSENVGTHPQAHDSAFYTLWNQYNTTLPMGQGKKTIRCHCCCLSSRISWRLRWLQTCPPMLQSPGAGRKMLVAPGDAGWGCFQGTELTSFTSLSD